MKILNLLAILDKNHPIYVFLFFETSKSWNCWPFYPTGGMSRMHAFEKCQCDRCQRRSVVKNMPPPSPSFPVPIPPPHPSANCPGPMISGLLDHVTLPANGSGAPGTQQAYWKPALRRVVIWLWLWPNNSKPAFDCPCPRIQIHVKCV